MKAWRLISTVASNIACNPDFLTPLFNANQATTSLQILHPISDRLTSTVASKLPADGSRLTPFNRYPAALFAASAKVSSGTLQRPLGAKSAISLERCIRNCVPACHEQCKLVYAAAPTWGPPLHYENTSEISSAELPYEVIMNLLFLDVVVFKETLPFSHGPSNVKQPSPKTNSSHTLSNRYL
ncbi:hypothetical protein CY34DRAFT_812409 [Suillus luteus UH-Slu-Lm8-n1]|uniref:Unplaced genomic scaffold CY34scaffold_531, whole genome shotgun sequence n=1 Tax=Suillus luteus UH-Slu-Lm8-n1 TaxID=930992 RepID=A0A0D0A005_9AGAM|nr:hypothetical protein CY34DRAFT_812409 [Suillus luteus UH-Slu-Lm8-n1]